ncbi:MAG: ABC transporter ATP-binding protein [Sphingobacteriales bacterium]|nr:ABC transporter ATP-binding protein [Sphingobacteriales bacterium]
MRKIFRNTWLVLDKRERRRFTVQVLLDVIISITDILFLAALLWIISFYIQHGTTENIPYFPHWLATAEPLMLIAGFVILFAIKNTAAYAVAKAHFTFAGQVAVRISAGSMRRYLQSGFSEFVMTDSSVWIRKIALQPFDFSQQVLSGFQQIIAQAILISLTVTAILVFNAKLFLLLFVILLPPVIAVFFFIRKRLGVVKKNIRETNERSYRYLLDALKGFVEANIYQRNDFFLDRFIHYRSRFSAALFNSLALQSLPSRMIEIFAIAGLFILIVIAEWTGNTGGNTLITIGAFMAAAYKIIPGMVRMINLAGQIKTYEFSAEELTGTFPDNRSAGSVSPADIHSMEMKNISFQYAGKDILKNFSLSASRGDLLGICGESGIGKTTVLNLLLGFLKPGTGEILINNAPVSHKMLRSYWPSVSYVRQQSFFIYDTIENNITLGEEKPDKSKLEFALKATGLDKLISSFSEGLQKLITENGKNISGGQQQRIALARALYKRADVYLLDEPFSELDKESAGRILEQLKKLAATGKIILISSHDKTSLSYCSQTISPGNE